MSDSLSSAPPARRPLIVAGALLAVMVVAAGVGTTIALLARAAGVSDGFAPLRPSAYLPPAVIGTLLGAAGWTAVRRTAKDPLRLLRRVAPVGLALSFVPDLVLLAEDSTGIGPLAVSSLVVLHLAAGGVTIASYHLLFPLPKR